MAKLAAVKAYTSDVRFAVEAMVVLVPPTREDLLPWMIRFLQDKEHADGIRVLDEYGWDFRVLGGLIERVRRAARAYLILEKQGFSAEGRALGRVDKGN